VMRSEATEKIITPREVASEITELYEFLTPRESGEILVKIEGVFHDGIAEAIIESEVEIAVPDATNQFCNEVIGHVRRQTYTPITDFDPDLNILNLRNGLYHFDTGELTAHDPLYYSRIQLPIKFDPTATCPKVWAFLRKVLPAEDSRLAVLEDAATTLIRDTRFQKAFMYVGSGANGKTTWLLVLNALLGRDNVTNESIHDLGMSRFGAGNIEGKLAVMYPDIAASEITLTGKLKAIISGDRISVERKGVQGYPIDPFAKLFYSANALPEVNDNSDAWFRRWRITEWSVQIESHERNPTILRELTTDRELAGLFNVLAGFARRMMVTGKFSYEASIPQLRTEWGDRANVIQSFITTCLVRGESESVESSELYAAYVKFCEDRNFTARLQTGFMGDLKSKVAIRIDDRKPHGKGTKSVRFWVGIGLREGRRPSGQAQTELGAEGSDGSEGSEGDISRHTESSSTIEPDMGGSEPSEPSELGPSDVALRTFKASNLFSRRSWPDWTHDSDKTEPPPSPSKPTPSVLYFCKKCGAGGYASPDSKVWKGHGELTGHTELEAKEIAP